MSRRRRVPGSHRLVGGKIERELVRLADRYDTTVAAIETEARGLFETRWVDETTFEVRNVTRGWSGQVSFDDPPAGPEELMQRMAEAGWMLCAAAAAGVKSDRIEPR